MATDKKEHLEEVLETHKMSHIDSLLDKYKEKRKEIKEDLEEEYKGKIYGVINSGSYAKHTAINIKFDLDIVTPFKKTSFSTLEDMFESVFDFLYEKYKSQATVRKQKVSIGIEFFPDEDGDVISVDVVPGRELNEDQYTEDNKINLYVHSRYGLIKEKEYLQTNIVAQIDHIKQRENERKVIRLLKIWKTTNRENYKSFFLELITIKGFENRSITGNIWDKLKSIMEYIRDNVAEDGFTLKDPGNSGNDVADTLDEFQKNALKQRMRNMLDSIDDNSDNIKLYFPINKLFQEKQGYGIKEGGSTFSIPSQNERFG